MSKLKYPDEQRERDRRLAYLERRRTQEREEDRLLDDDDDDDESEIAASRRLDRMAERRRRSQETEILEENEDDLLAALRDVEKSRAWFEHTTREFRAKLDYNPMLRRSWHEFTGKGGVFADDYEKFICDLRFRSRPTRQKKHMRLVSCNDVGSPAGRRKSPRADCGMPRGRRKTTSELKREREQGQRRKNNNRGNDDAA